MSELSTFHFEIKARSLKEALSKLALEKPAPQSVVNSTVTISGDLANVSDIQVEAAKPAKNTNKKEPAKAEPKAAAEAEEASEITLEEVREVSGLLTKTGRSREAKAILENYFKVGKLADLNPDDYAEAIRLFKETAEKPPLEE